jgi:hypothetical protein
MKSNIKYKWWNEGFNNGPLEIREQDKKLLHASAMHQINEKINRDYVKGSLSEKVELNNETITYNGSWKYEKDE